MAEKQMMDIQRLESRRLLAADPFFQLTSKGTLIITGTDAGDEITIQLKHGQQNDGVQLIVQPDRDGALAVLHQASISYAKMKHIRIDAGGGDDKIFISGGDQMTRPATILGGDGDDQISYSSSAPTFVDAGAGDDLITGAAIVSVGSTKNSDVLDAAFAAPNSTAAATIMGGDGDDSLYGDTNDQIDGGAGNDTASVLFSGKAVSDARISALAHDYYARLGATGIEVTKGASTANFEITKSIFQGAVTVLT
jgi:RTX calcium-binding nonapeptide repeat (4 copies)